MKTMLTMTLLLSLLLLLCGETLVVGLPYTTNPNPPGQKSATDIADADYFDCRRAGQDCMNNGVCDVITGNCKCAINFTTFDCALSRDMLGKPPCKDMRDSCGDEGGMCYNKKGNTTCQCPENLYGEHCEKKRFEVTCRNDSMLIVMNAGGLFSGEIYVDGEKNDAGCMFSQSALPADRSGLALDISDVQCGGVTRESDSTNTRRVIVQFDARYFTATDINVTVQCGEGTSTVELRKDYQSVITYGHIQDEDIDNTPAMDSSAVEFNIKLRDGSPISKTVPLNEQLTFEFIPRSTLTEKRVCVWKKYLGGFLPGGGFVNVAMTDEQDCKNMCDGTPQCVAVNFYYFDIGRGKSILCSMFNTSRAADLHTSRGYVYFEKQCTRSVTETSADTIRVESCIAKNTQTDKDREILQILENSCPSVEIGKLMQENPTRTNNTITFKLQPFKFNNNTEITIICDVKVCPQGKEKYCDPVVCGRSEIRTRKRRSADQTTVEKTFSVEDSEHTLSTDFMADGGGLMKRSRIIIR